MGDWACGRAMLWAGCPSFHWLARSLVCQLVRSSFFSHSLQRFDFETYIGISPYHTLYSGFHLRRISVSAHITRCAVVFTVRRISVSAYITLCTVVFTLRRVSVSAYITRCVVLFTLRLISVSAHITLLV